MTRGVLILVAGIVLGLALARVLTPAAPDVAERAMATVDPDPDADDPAQDDGKGVLTLDPAARALAGIASGSLAVTDATATVVAPGRVADTRALLAAHAALDDARRVAAAQSATLAALADRRARLESYARAGELAIAQELARVDLEARRETARAARQDADIHAQERALIAHWGDTLAELATRDPELWAALRAGRRCLLEGVLPVRAAAVMPGTPLAFAARPADGATHPAILLAPAPSVASEGIGQRWFAHTDCSTLQTGQRVDLELPVATARGRGRLLPAAAMVWHAGARWYFVEISTGRFQRQRVVEDALIGADAVLPEEMRQPVVTQGAQALLAEEQRAAIPEEDDD